MEVALEIAPNWALHRTRQRPSGKGIMKKHREIQRNRPIGCLIHLIVRISSLIYMTSKIIRQKSIFARNSSVVLVCIEDTKTTLLTSENDLISRNRHQILP